MKTKICTICRTEFSCGSDNVTKPCWCADYPAIMPLDLSGDCRCPSCLKAIIQQRISEYVKTVTPENASSSIAGKFNTEGNLIEDIDYYVNEEGNLVFTAWYHLKRGKCCRNGCKHCPYGFKK